MAHTYYKKPKVKKNRRKRRKQEKKSLAQHSSQKSGLNQLKTRRKVKPAGSKHSPGKKKIGQKTLLLIAGLVLLAFTGGLAVKYQKSKPASQASLPVKQHTDPQAALPSNNSEKEPALLLAPPTEEEQQRHSRIIEHILNKRDDKLLQLSRQVAGIKQQELKESIELANDYLYSLLDEQGKFTYRLNLNPSVALSPKYNMLRHAGTIYAMSMYAAEFGAEEGLEKMVQAATYLKQTGLKPAGESGMLGIWSYSEITGSGDPPQVKLGGAGLGLVALLSVEQLRPGTTSAKELKQLGEFILYMQREDGGFYSKYIPSKGGKDASWTSLYYPGEAALGLVMLYEYDQNLRWLTGAAKALAYLARSRYGKTRVEADHWALLATARLLPRYHLLANPPAPREMILQHAVQVCGSMLDQGANNMIRPHQYGCFTFDGRTTPTATRMEGLLAALSFLPEAYSVLRQRIEAAVELGTGFLIQAQIKEGEHKGAICRGTRQLQTGMSKNDLDYFNRRQTEVRIDYVQHPLSAFIQYKNYKGWGI